jgi:hypothetical protein
LLANPVAAHDIKQDAVDSDAEILKENKTGRTGHYWLRWLQPNFECGAFNHSLWQCLPQRDMFQLGNH